MSIKKIGIIAILLIVIGAVINIGLSVAGGFVQNTQEIKLKDETFTSINITGDNTTIEVLPTNSNHGNVEFISKKSSRSKIEAHVKGDTLHVEMKKKFFQAFNFGFNSSGNKIIVSVPNREYKELVTQTDNGQIVANNLQIERVNIESNNGKIVLKDLESKKISIKTDNGKINMQDVTGDIEAKSDNGQISLVTENLDRSIALKTDNGLISIQTKSEPKNATIHAEIDNGRIDIFGSSNEETIFGKGKHKINLKTDNGIITIKKGN